MDDIQEIKADVKELIKLGAVHNELLRTHEARSLALQVEQEKLEKELEPIKNHVFLVDIMLKASGGIVIALIGEWLIKHYVGF